MRVELPNGSVAILEVKGMAKDAEKLRDLRTTLRVNSKDSHDDLVTGQHELYRVSGVFSRRPQIHLMEYGIDYTLKETYYAEGRVGSITAR